MILWNIYTEEIILCENAAKGLPGRQPLRFLKRFLI